MKLRSNFVNSSEVSLEAIELYVMAWETVVFLQVME